MTHWVMVIDTRHCIGCETCILACSQANGVTNGAWRKLVEYGAPVPPDRQRHFLTRSCMHCQEPPCRDVCPTKATYQRDDGIVAVDHDRCVGCGACILACPYDAREIHTARHGFEAGTGRDQEREGTCTKCHFCMPRLEKGIQDGFKPGIDPEATPACVAACLAGALHFGDLDDPESTVSRLISANRTTTLGEELGTKPSVYYII